MRGYAETNRELEEEAIRNTADITGVTPELIRELYVRTEECTSVYPIPYTSFATHTTLGHHICSIKTVPSSQGVAVDIGANIGAFSFLAARHFDKVYAFEPLQENYKKFLTLISSSISKEGNIIVPYNIAVGGSNKQKIKIYANEKNPDSSSIFPHYTPNINSANYDVVRQINLKEIYKLINRDYIDYLKIDIEGAEYEFLYQKNLSHIKYIAIEIGRPPAGSPATFRELSDYLTDLFFPIYVFQNHFFGINRNCVNNLKRNNLNCYSNLKLLDNNSPTRRMTINSDHVDDTAMRESVYNQLKKGYTD